MSTASSSNPSSPEPASQYSRVLIVIHWLTAAGVVLAVALGWRLADAGGTEREAVLAWHMSAGIAILTISLARLAARWLSPRPPPVGSRWEQRAASWVHGAFYVLLIVIPLLGWLAVSGNSGQALKVFGFIRLPALPGAGDAAAFAEGAHRFLAYGLCVLLLGHLAAAFKHAVADAPASLARILPGAQRPWNWRLLSLAGVFVLAFVYGNGIADPWLPRAVRLSGEPETLRFAAIDPRRAHVFATVQPILDDKCVSCHGSSAQKGGLRLDSFAAAMRGGANGKVIVPGKLEDSEFIQRILMPPSHKHAMPPAGKPPLTPAESQIVMWWITAGADDSTTIAAANPPPLVQTVLQNFGVSGDSPVFRKAVSLADAGTLARLREQFEVQALFRGEGFLQAQPRFDQEHRPLQLDSLAGVADQLVRLDLSGSSIPAAQYASLSRLRNLQRLNLANTLADDASVSELTSLPNLEVLNLYGTRVTDASLATVQRMPSLMTVYLTGSAVTGDGVEKLRKAQPGLSVVWVPAETGQAPTPN